MPYAYFGPKGTPEFILRLARAKDISLLTERKHLSSLHQPNAEARD